MSFYYHKLKVFGRKQREKADFELFRPYLEKIVDMNKRFIDYWGYKGNKYNTLLDLYEPGMTVEVLDQVFQRFTSKVLFHLFEK